MERQKGAALIYVLFVTTLLLLLGGAYLAMVQTEAKIAVNQQRSTQALFLAEAGIERAFYEMLNEDGWVPDGYHASEAFDAELGVDSRYDVQVIQATRMLETDDGNGEDAGSENGNGNGNDQTETGRYLIDLKSVGYVANAVRTLQVRIEYTQNNGGSSNGKGNQPKNGQGHKYHTQGQGVGHAKYGCAGDYEFKIISWTELGTG